MSGCGVAGKAAASGRMGNFCTRRRSGAHGSGVKGELGTTTTRAAWRRGMAETGVAAATSAASATTSSGSAPAAEHVLVADGGIEDDGLLGGEVLG